LILVFVFLIGSLISLAESPQDLQLLHLKMIYHLNRVLGQKFTRNAKDGFECLMLF
jgi:hypothetical protein